jgi:hypothetical protein
MASALGFIAICIIVIGALGILPRAMSKTIAPQEQMSPVKPSAAFEAQRQAPTKLIRSSTFDHMFQKLSEKAKKKRTVSNDSDSWLTPAGLAFHLLHRWMLHPQPIGLDGEEIETVCELEGFALRRTYG